jgi:type VI secretion system protein ImpB
MARESTQTKLTRVRPPRVQISYEVNVGGAIEIKEIPFVMGVLGDFTGQPTEPLEPLAKRKFVEVTPDNFDDVLGKMKPHLAMSVKNTLSAEPDGPKLKVDLEFKKLDDFDPEQVARQVKPLSDLLDLRTKLSNLRATIQTNQKLDDILQDVVKNSDSMSKLKGELESMEKKGEGNE